MDAAHDGDQLEALAGEYASAADPDTPLSFYVQDGKLIVESERDVPLEFTRLSALEFGFPNSSKTFRFTVDASGHGESVVESTDLSEVYRRTGAAVHHVFHDYQQTEVMIPMRDGIKLHAVILKPADIAAPLPFLIQRTPYGADGTSRASFFASRPELARDGYIYVCEDIRGRHKSEGKFVMSRPLSEHGADRRNAKAVDESTDTYDTVAWLLANVRRQQWARGLSGDQLSRVSGNDGGHRSAPGGEGDFAAGADDRCVDGRRLLSQRRLPAELRVRLCAGDGIEQGRVGGELRQRQVAASLLTGSIIFSSADRLPKM